MIRLVALSICLLIGSTLKAQLTNGIVYNFEVGDVLQTRISDYNFGGTFYYLDTIIQKSISSDTVFYTRKRVVIESFGPYYVYASTHQQTLQYVISAQLAPFPQGSCLPPTDSTFIGACGEDVYVQSSNYDTTCFEPPVWYATYHEGLGGPYAEVENVAQNIHYETELVYSNTQQWGECGTYINYTSASVSELEPNTKILVAEYNALGQKTDIHTKGLVIQVYQDGTIRKIFR